MLDKTGSCKTWLGEPPGWDNSRSAGGDLADGVRSLESEGDEPPRAIGRLSVVKALLGAGLVDRPRLVVLPQVLGNTGREPIFEGLPDVDLELIGTDSLDGRLVALGYRPANADPAGRAAPEEGRHGPVFAASPSPATRPGRFGEVRLLSPLITQPRGRRVLRSLPVIGVPSFSKIASSS